MITSTTPARSTRLTPPPPQHLDPLVVVSGVQYTVGAGSARRTVLRDASLEVGRGEWVAVMGPSGCGKSSLLSIVGGLMPADSGVVTIADVKITALSDAARARFRRRHIGVVFQEYNLVDDLTVIGNVALPLLLTGNSSRRSRRRAQSMLDRLGLADRAGSWPGALSGGEQQRVAIARALAAVPDVVLADEPTGALDSESTRTVMDLLSAARDEGQTIVMVTHDRELAAIADRIVHMRDGLIGAGPFTGGVAS